ncbi:MAG: hypothetical protein ACRDQA_22595 [Nocardioidaceae bacterium]
MSEQQLREALDDLAGQVPGRGHVTSAWSRGRRRRHWQQVGVAVAALAVVGAGVSIAQQVPGDSGPTVVSAGNDARSDRADHGPTTGQVPFATYDNWQPGDSGMNALATGTLVLDGGCIYLDTGHGRNLVLIFPSQTRWHQAAQTISLEGKSVKVGERVGFGGGNVDTTSADHIPTSCQRSSANAAFFLVNGSFYHKNELRQ